MVQSNSEYQEALKRLRKEALMIAKQEKYLRKNRYSEKEIERAMNPLISFHEQLKEEIEAYEQRKNK